MLIGPARWFRLVLRMVQIIRRRNDRDQGVLIRSLQRLRSCATRQHLTISGSASRFAAGTLAATAPHIQETQGVTELFALLPVFVAALMAARALAQAGYNPLGAAHQRLSRQAEC